MNEKDTSSRAELSVQVSFLLPHSLPPKMLLACHPARNGETSGQCPPRTLLNVQSLFPVLRGVATCGAMAKLQRAGVLSDPAHLGALAGFLVALPQQVLQKLLSGGLGDSGSGPWGLGELGD